MTNLSKERKRAEGESASVPVKSELSRQLCEICGIEPQEDKYCFWECKNPELENKPCNNTECPHYRDNKYYINFKEPDNFMKLFSLPIKIKSSEPTETIIHILSMRFHIFDVEDFLNALYKYLTGYNDYGEQIIEVIKEKEWVYG